MRTLTDPSQLGAWMTGVVDGLKATLKAGLVHLKGKAAQYPPSTIANSPGRQQAYNRKGKIYYRTTWYERGLGQWYQRKNGSRVIDATSETLGRQWAMEEPTFSDGGLTGRVGNNASYGPWVQGSKQAAFHKARGWQTVEDVVEQEKPTIIEFFMARINQLLGGGA